MTDRLPSGCATYERLAVAGEDAGRAAEEHLASGCAACREIAAAQHELELRLSQWATPQTPPDRVEERLRRAVAARRRFRAPRSVRRRLLPVAASITLLAISLGLWGLASRSPAPDEAQRLLAADALAAAERAEREHARAVAALRQAAAPTLARAQDPATPASEAALLLSLRDRLSSLDATIAEIEGYLEENPANPAARTVLLAAYRDQTNLLRRVMALGDA